MEQPTRITTPTPPRTVRISWTTAVLAVGAVLAFLVLRSAFTAAHRVLGWTVACTVAAVVIEPFTSALGRYIPRILAVLGTSLVLAVAVTTVVIGSIDDLDREVGRLRDATPAAIDRLQSRDDEIGRVTRELALDERAEVFLDVLDERVGSASGAVVDNASSAPVYLVCGILTLFLLVYGPRIAAGFVAQIDDDERAAQVDAVVRRALVQARRAFVALLGQGVVVGVVVGLVAWGLDLPAPIVLGLLAGVLATLPDVGIVLGAVPAALMALAFHSTASGMVLVVAAVALQVVEAVWIRRLAARVGTDTGPAVVWIVALLGYAVYGPGMAFYGVAVAIFVLAVIDELPGTKAAGAAGAAGSADTA